MGYTTKFTGAIQLSRKLTMAEAKHILEINEEPETLKGKKPNDGYMQWVPTESLDQIVWDENEKFYDYIPWMRWMCELLQGWDIAASGILHWSGESAGDTGTIIVKDNEVQAIVHTKPQASKSRPLTLDALREMALDQLTA